MTPWDHEKQRAQGCHGQEDAQTDAGKIHPKVTDAPVAVTGREPSDKRSSDGNAYGTGDEVLDRHAEHLRQLRHRSFTGVGLPVGIGCKRDRSIPRLVRIYWAHAVRPRQVLLEALQ